MHIKGRGELRFYGTFQCDKFIKSFAMLLNN